MAEKTSQQSQPGKDPLYRTIESAAPMIMPLLQGFLGSKDITLGEYTGRFPIGLDGLYNVGQMIPDWLGREQLEEMMGPMSKTQEMHAKALARRFNEVFAKMNPREAAKFADKKFHGSRIAAWIMMQATGTNSMLTEMERSSDLLRRKGVDERKIQTRNQRVSSALNGLYQTVLDPRNYGKYGNLTPLEMTSAITGMIKSGGIQDIINNSDNFGPGNKIKPQAMKALQNRVYDQGSIISYGLSSGIVSDPSTASQELTNFFKFSPVPTLGAEGTKEFLKRTSNLVRATGLPPEGVRSLMEQAGPNAMYVVNDFLTLMASDKNTRMEGVSPEGYNKSVLGVVNRAAPAVEVMGGLYAILKNERPEQADSIIQELMADKNNWRHSKYLKQSMRDVLGHDIDGRYLTTASKSADARNFRMSGRALPYVMHDLRDRISQSMGKVLGRTGLPMERSLGGGYVAKEPLLESGAGQLEYIRRNAPDFETQMKAQYALDNLARRHGFDSGATMEKIMGIGGWGEVPDTFTDVQEDLSLRSRLSDKEESRYRRNGRNVGGLYGFQQALMDPETKSIGDAFGGFVPDNAETAKDLYEGV